MPVLRIIVLGGALRRAGREALAVTKAAHLVSNLLACAYTGHTTGYCSQPKGGGLEEGRESYRRSGGDRRQRQMPVSVDRRTGGGRRARSDRRARESIQGALSRADAKTDARTDAKTDGAAAAAPRAQAAEPGPRKPGRVVLNDIVLRSLAAADSDAFAARLLKLKVFASVETAKRASGKTPSVLARYVGDETSHAVCFALKETGADVVLQGSHVNCPHCAFPLPCEGEANESRGGIVFSCPSCSGLTMLDVRDRSFHPLLRCSACKSLLYLPTNARTGRYRCRCGKILSYNQAQVKAEVVADPTEDMPSPRASRKPKPRNRQPAL